MKRLTTILIAFALTLGLGLAQGTFIGTYMEMTHVSPKAGIQLGKQIEYTVETGDGYRVMAMEFGVFYQTVPNSMIEAPSETVVEFNTQEEEFAGLFFAGRVASFDKGSIYFNVRSGVTNRENFTITPSVIAGYKLFRHLEINLGSGIRNLKPTVQGGLRLTL